MFTKKIFNNAAFLIDANGLAKGTFLDEDTGAMCALGALKAAAGYHPKEILELDGWQGFKYTMAYTKLSRYLEAKGYDWPSNWSDHQQTTEKDVVQVFRELAK